MAFLHTVSVFVQALESQAQLLLMLLQVLGELVEVQLIVFVFVSRGYYFLKIKTHRISDVQILHRFFPGVFAVFSDLFSG